MPLLRRLTVVGLLVSSSFAAHGRLYLNLTGSMPIGVYRRLAGPPERGDIVVACLPKAITRLALARGYVWAGTCPGNTAPIGKAVVAMSGDTVTVLASGIAVNGIFLQHTMRVARDSWGRPMDHVADGRHFVGESELWLVSTHHPLSFDSRYFGPVAVTDVVAHVRPLYAFEIR